MAKFKLLWKGALLCLFCIIGYGQPSFSQVPPVKLTKQPFWEARPKAQSKIYEDKEIVVSVTAKKSDKKTTRLTMLGIGVLNRPIAKAFKLSKDFSNLKKVSDYIKDVQFNNHNSRLYLHSKAFGYHAIMFMNYQFVESKGQKEIRFHIFKGTFAGMIGVIRFKDYKRRKSEIQLLAQYDYVDLKIPKFFIEFGLEVVLQKIASKLRVFIEKAP